MTGGHKALARRRRQLAALVALPAAAAACALVLLQLWHWRSPDHPLFARPFAYSLAEAIERDDVVTAYEFIRAGQDPGELIAVRHPVLTGSRTVLMPPLVWAVAVQSRQAVLMLLAYSERSDRTTGQRAVCLAEALGHAEIAQLLRTHGADAASPCPAPAEAERGLLLSCVAAQSSGAGTGHEPVDRPCPRA